MIFIFTAGFNDQGSFDTDTEFPPDQPPDINNSSLIKQSRETDSFLLHGDQKNQGVSIVLRYVLGVLT